MSDGALPGGELVDDRDEAADADADADALVRWLSAHDATCPVCHYELRGLTTTVCPECAHELQLRVGAQRLLQAPWLLAIIAASMGLGFDGVMAVLLNTALLIFGPSSGPEPAILRIFFVILAAVSGLALWLLVKRRAMFAKAPWRRQWKMGIACFVGVGLAHLIAAVMMFRLLI